ncbi:hypothetical protein FACS1894191_8420 [Clostridia bacterium]|nr:hypothetical protein FACS1894191_8420 [Clostridia bacterium]
MNYQTYHIPANFTDAGKLFGLFGIRNTVEAVTLAGPPIFLCLRFLPFSITTNLIIALVTGIPLGGFALIGVQDDPLTIFIRAWWRWRKNRGAITYRGSPDNDGDRRRHK